MSKNKKIQLAAISSILASLMLILGDVCLLGYEALPEKYPLFAKEYADKLDLNISIQLLEAPTKSLMIGSLLISFSIPLLIPAIWLVYQTFRKKDKWYAIFIYYGLITGTILTPLLHSKIVFVAEIHKAILNTDKSSHEYLIEIAQNFTKIFYIGWSVAMFFLTVSWLAYSICVFSNKTLFSKKAGLITPFILMVFVLILINVSPKPFSTLFSGAGLSVSYLIFFITTAFFTKRNLMGT